VVYLGLTTRRVEKKKIERGVLGGRKAVVPF